MVGMRNRIAHGCKDLDMNVVWETVNDALPRLLAAVEPHVKRFIAEFESRTSKSSNGKS